MRIDATSGKLSDSDRRKRAEQLALQMCQLHGFGDSSSDDEN